MTTSSSDKSKPLTWAARCVFALLIGCGVVFWFIEHKRQRPLRAQWHAYLQASGNLPAAGPGEIVVRTVPGDHKNQWKIHLRCGDSCKVDLNVAKGVFHRSEMQPLDSFHSMAELRQTPSICWCVEGLVTTIEVSLEQRSDSSWELNIDGLYALRAALDAGGNPIVADQLQFAGASEATTFAMTEPIRLLDIELPHAGNSKDLMMNGVCVYARVEQTEL